MKRVAYNKDYILARIEIDPRTNCWNWTKGRSKQGYGIIYGVHDRPSSRPARMVHRTAFQLWNGLVPEGLCVCHRCDNPPCCNPEHLFTGTQKENMQDAGRKGRMRVPHPNQDNSGEKNPRAKLSKENVISIFYSKLTNMELSRQYKVSDSVIWSIRKQRTWKCITGNL